MIKYLIILLAAGFMTGCGSQPKTTAPIITEITAVQPHTSSLQSGRDAIDQSATETLTGYLVIDENTVHFDEVEVVYREDTERIQELGLQESSDYPSGFAILNDKEENTTYTITKDTTYTFTVIETEIESVHAKHTVCSTNKKEDFLKHLGKLNETPLTEQTIPYHIEVKDGQIINITEDFAFTI